MENKTINLIREYFLQSAQQLRENWTEVDLFLCRSDGVLLCSSSGPVEKFRPQEEQTIGVLISGMWQAAKAMADLIPDKLSDDYFRLNFDTSDKGICVLPVCLMNKDHYLAAMFTDQINPAPLKANLRSIAGRLEGKFANVSASSSEGRSDKSSGYLFKDVTDDEVEKMFSSMGIN